jgi:site-specific DNA recombinase
MRVICYARFSPKPAKPGSANEPDSAEKQLEDLEAHASAQGWPVDPEYCHADKEFSRDNGDRPGLARAIKQVRKGSVFLVRSLERIGEGAVLSYVMSEIEARGGKLVTLDNGSFDLSDPMVEFMATLLGAVARLQRRMIGNGTRRGMRRKLTNGKYNGCTPPYGYRWTKEPTVDPETGKRVGGEVEIDPEQQETIDVIQGLAAANKGWVRIARELNEMGVACRDNKPWTQWKIRNVLGVSKPKRRRRRQNMPRL